MENDWLNFIHCLYNNTDAYKIRAAIYCEKILLANSDGTSREFTVKLESQVRGVDCGYNLSYEGVNGYAEAGNDTLCKNVKGNIEAGNKVNYVKVDGDINAGSIVEYTHIKNTTDILINISLQQDYTQ